MNCDYVTLLGKRDFADVTELRIQSWGDDPLLSGWTFLITSICIVGSVRSREGDVATVSQVRMMQDFEPRNVGNL